MAIKKCGIYGIKNKNNQKIYIGSSKDIATRWSSHKHYLKGRNKDKLIHKNIHLQKDWDLFGEDSFEFVILEECEPEVLLEKEQKWMNAFTGKTYNITDAIRLTLPEEMRKSISKGKQGVYLKANKEFFFLMSIKKIYLKLIQVESIQKHKRKLMWENTTSH